MRTVLHSTAGWGALPFIALGGLAYGWVVSWILSRQPRPQTRTTERRAA